jgi:hypothetical protein
MTLGDRTLIFVALVFLLVFFVLTWKTTTFPHGHRSDAATFIGFS